MFYFFFPHCTLHFHHAHFRRFFSYDGCIHGMLQVICCFPPLAFFSSQCPFPSCPVGEPWIRFMSTNNRCNCLASAVIPGTLPWTYDRGAADACIDLGIRFDEVLHELIVVLQFEPFYSTGIYDHRGLIVDLKINKLLGGIAYDTTKSTCRRILETNQPQSTNTMTMRGH